MRQGETCSIVLGEWREPKLQKGENLMSEEKMLLEYMEKHNEEFLDMLKEAVNLESPTEGDKEDLKKCRDYFERTFSEIGFKCNVVPSNDSRYGDHLLMELGEGDEQVLFVGHYDTVYEKGAFGDVWKQEGTKVWGPGVFDMKGGDLQVYMVGKALKELSLFPKNKKIVFFLSSDEEAGSPTSHMHYKELAKKSKASFVVEPTFGDYSGGLTIGRYARGNYTFVAEGKPAHSGQEPENAESSLKELAQQAVYLESLTDLENGVAIACTCLNSGNAGWPTVPGFGELTIDARFSSADIAEKYDSLFQNLKPFNSEVKITTKGGIEKPPFDENHAAHRALYENAKEVGKRFNMDMTGDIGRAGTDGNFTASVGCPTLDGMGMSGDFAHQPGKEYINTDDIAVRGAFVAHMVLEVLRGE
ncbi:M20/M25/M40 family metallo-hydrolase [Virgibacillus sp. NKC19-16]|uniref:M20/M25/M40 family metallo-hydrolase n=1 Tax=Virgibacillus salidurans TaxID=2831673 RepID=UPI001F31DCCF|nr:M20/M25/M40 family metallo-hydrolase [Virgibacillus sp. NKC19-16]UJL47453.1 M20/M25/M40 family metallo-hydrolase [Virgibacillus sp. NKC19-16]